MSPLTAARAQMELSLGFHIVFAAMGIAMPVLLLAAEGIALRTGNGVYLTLARRWARVTALVFAIGAVSGTALSFELGLLWPGLMRLAGSALGPTFALEGYAFFLEAIFLGLYLYGWDRLTPWQHWLTGVPVAVSGAASGALVCAANAWMQCPGPARVVSGVRVGVDPTAAFRSPAWGPMALHAVLASYEAVGFAVAGTAAVALLKGRTEPWHRPALRLSMAMATVAAVAQPVSGDLIAVMVATWQPAKLAAMEAHFHTAREVPLLVGGVPDAVTGTVRGALRIPYGLSLLAKRSLHAEVTGLDAFAPDARPSVTLVHLAFDLMVLTGSALMALGVGYHLQRWRVQGLGQAVPRWLLWAVALASPLGFLALESGWVVTEAGRQPWTIQGLLRTRDAVTTDTHGCWTLGLFTVLYVGLTVVLGVALQAIQREGTDHGSR